MCRRLDLPLLPSDAARPVRGRGSEQRRSLLSLRPSQPSRARWLSLPHFLGPRIAARRLLTRARDGAVPLISRSARLTHRSTVLTKTGAIAIKLHDDCSLAFSQRTAARTKRTIERPNNCCIDLSIPHAAVAQTPSRACGGRRAPAPHRQPLRPTIISHVTSSPLVQASSRASAATPPKVTPASQTAPPAASALLAT